MTMNNSDTTQMQPALDLEAIEARADAATPGPWHPGADEFAETDEMIRQLGVALSRGGNTLHLALARRTHEEAVRAADAAGADVDAGTVFAALVGNGPNSGANAAFIAAARTDVPDLVAEVRRMREEIAAAGQWRRVTADTAFAAPFGTIRACGGCGCLVTGGPTRCARCAQESA